MPDESQMLIGARREEVSREAVTEVWTDGEVIRPGFEIRTEQTCRLRSTVREHIGVGESPYESLHECRRFNAMGHISS
jgi:hypothetical protein